MNTRTALRWLLSVIYIGFGCLHLARPHGFLAIMPPAIPYPLQVVLFTGACEVAGGLGLLIPWTRKAAGIGLAAYAVCVYPANIQHAVNFMTSGAGLGWAYHGPRLLFQPVIVWWCLWASTAIDWPFRRSQAAARVPPIRMDRI